LPALTSIHLVRHGEVYNPHAVYYGRLPGFALSEHGRRHARTAAQALRAIPLTALYSSPLLRARQTAQIVQAAHPGLSIQVSELLNEVRTPFEGQGHAELDAVGWDVYTGSGPEYEQPRDILARVQRFLSNVRRACAGRQVAAVTHGDVIAFTVLWAKGRPVTPERGSLDLPDGYPALGSICTLVYETEAPHEMPALRYQRPARQEGSP
jgi:broad specificity phosphatase PhoE